MSLTSGIEVKNVKGVKINENDIWMENESIGWLIYDMCKRLGDFTFMRGSHTCLSNQ